MRRFTTSAAAAAIGCLALAGAAQAAIQQQADIRLTAATGSGVAVGHGYAKVDAYLATRDPASTRTGMKANAVGSVRITFPRGTTPNVNATPGCRLAGKASPAKVKAACSRSQIGDGWALLNNLGSDPLGQLAEAPPACALDDASQYTRTYNAGAPSCTPRGFIWVHVRAYQGTGNGRVVTNRKAVIFSNFNGVSPLSFAGSVTANVLSVTLPAMNGAGSQPGELPLGVVLSDFQLSIRQPKYLRLGACPSSKVMSVSTVVRYSKFISEPTVPAPPSQTLVTNSACR